MILLFPTTGWGLHISDTQQTEGYLAPPDKQVGAKRKRTDTWFFLKGLFQLSHVMEKGTQSYFSCFD